MRTQGVTQPYQPIHVLGIIRPARGFGGLDQDAVGEGLTDKLIRQRLCHRRIGQIGQPADIGFAYRLSEQLRNFILIQYRIRRTPE